MAKQTQTSKTNANQFAAEYILSRLRQPSVFFKRGGRRGTSHLALPFNNPSVIGFKTVCAAFDSGNESHAAFLLCRFFLRTARLFA